MPIPIVPLAIMAAGMIGARKVGQRRAQTEIKQAQAAEDAKALRAQTAADRKAQQNFIIDQAKKAVETGNTRAMGILALQGKNVGLDLQPQTDIATLRTPTQLMAEATRSLVAGKKPTAKMPLTPSERGAVTIGTGADDLPTPTTEPLISPELAERAEFETDKDGNLKIKIGKMKFDYKLRTDKRTGESWYDIFQNDKLTGQTPKVFTEIPFAEKEQKLAVIEQVDNEGKVISQTLDRVGEGFVAGPNQRVRPFTSGGTTVNIMNDMSKKTQGLLEGTVVEAADTLQKLADIERLTTSDYFSYIEQGQSYLGKITNKLQIPGPAKTILNALGITNTDDFRSIQAEWKTMVDVNTMLWRKYITGVAGGEKEMMRIEGITPNKNDDYVTFMAKIKAMKAMAEAARKRAQFFLQQGVKLNELSPEMRANVIQSTPLSRFGFQDYSSLGQAGKDFLDKKGRGE